MLVASTVIAPAEEFAEKLDVTSRVTGLVPAGFERYLRIFNPVDTPAGTMPMSALARELGIPLRSDTMWERDIESASPSAGELGQSEFGEPNAALAQALGEILQRHEPHERTWYFARSAIYGDLDPGSSAPLTDEPQIRLPQWLTRPFVYLPRPFSSKRAAPPNETVFPTACHGPLPMRIYDRRSAGPGAPFEVPRVPAYPLDSPGRVPMYWWPEGLDWCVGQALYGIGVYVGCGSAIAEEILADPRLDAIEVAPDDEAEHEE